MCDKLRDKLSSSEFLQQLASNEGEKPVDLSVIGDGGSGNACWLSLAWCCNFGSNVVFM
jgi:hypothetical protein